MKKFFSSILLISLFLLLSWYGGDHHLASFNGGKLAFLLGCYGLVTIIKDSSITYPIAQLLGKLPVVGESIYLEDNQNGDSGLLACSMCTGTWCGAVCAILGLTLYPIGDGLLGARDIIIHGAIGAAWSYASYTVLQRLGAYQN